MSIPESPKLHNDQRAVSPADSRGRAPGTHTIECPERPWELLLPTRIKDMLRACPRAGNGVHQWIIKVAVRLIRYLEDWNDIYYLIDKHSANCGRPVEEDEIRDAIRSGARWLSEQRGKPSDVPHAPKWPELNMDLVQSIVRDGPTLADLHGASPVRCASDGPRCSEQVIDQLLPGNPLICAGPDPKRSVTAPRQAWRLHLARQAYIVPSPMSARQGIAKSGTISARCADNTGPRRFLVVESDKTSFDVQAAVLKHLGSRLPLCLVVHSMGKSLHGWFYCANQPEELLRDFFSYAVSLGADRVHWSRCQLTRMPDGTRKDNSRQWIVYFNPQSTEVA